MTVLAARIADEFQSSNDGWGVRVVAAHEQLVSASRPALLVLMGAVAFLLLIVCANMANLLLARLSGRRREIAVRAARGAGRWDLARPILAESLLLSVVGGGLGLLVAVGGLRLLTTLPEGGLPRMEAVTLDGGVLLFTTAVSILVAVAFGLLPALQASRSHLREHLTESTGATGSFAARRTLSSLVVVEVALASVLLVGAGLMVRSFSTLLQVHPGFEPNNVVAAQVYLPTTTYRQRPQIAQFFEDVIERLRRAPGVTNASAVSTLPMQAVAIASALPFSVEGRVPPETEDPRADVRMVAHGYFETMKIPLLDGRFFDDRDTADATRTAVINETMARRFFPDRSPVGLFIENPHGRNEVVGVVADVRNQGLDSEPKKQVYLPLRQNPVPAMSLVARTERDPMAFAATLQREIWAVDAAQPIYDLSTMDQHSGARGLSAAAEHHIAGDLCGCGAAACRLGYLWGVVLLGDPADPRDRAPDGAGRHGSRDGWSRRPKQHAPGGHRCRCRPRGRSGTGALDGRYPLRCEHVRPRGIRGGRSGAGNGRAQCQPRAGATCRADRPDGGVAGPVMRCTRRAAVVARRRSSSAPAA